MYFEQARYFKYLRRLIRFSKVGAQPEGSEAKSKVAFLHIPKASGMAMAQGLRDLLQPKLPIFGWDASFFGDFDDFQSIDQEIRRMIYLDPGSLPTHADLITAHMALSTLNQTYPDYRIITILREPRSRLLSLWLYWRSLSEATIAAWGGWGVRMKKAFNPLSEFLDDPALACQTDNIALRMLVHPHPLVPVNGFIQSSADKILLRAAYRAMNKINLCLLYEDDSSDDHVSDFFRGKFNRRRLNETSNVDFDISAELTQGTFAGLASRTRLDRQLWMKLAESKLPDINSVVLSDHTFFCSLLTYERRGRRSFEL